MNAFSGGSPLAGLGKLTPEVQSGQEVSANESDLRQAQDDAAAQTQANEMSQAADLGGAAAAAQVDETGAPSPIAVYTSHPIVRYAIGRFQFESSTLKLFKQQDVEDFEALIKNADVQTQHTVRRVDASLAEQIAREFVQSRTTTGIDTTASDLPA